MQSISVPPRRVRLVDNSLANSWSSSTVFVMQALPCVSLINLLNPSSRSWLVSLCLSSPFLSCLLLSLCLCPLLLSCWQCMTVFWQRGWCHHYQRPLHRLSAATDSGLLYSMETQGRIQIMVWQGHSVGKSCATRGSRGMPPAFLLTFSKFGGSRT